MNAAQPNQLPSIGRRGAVDAEEARRKPIHRRDAEAPRGRKERASGTWVAHPLPGGEGAEENGPSRDMTADDIRRMARDCGFELAGVARAEEAEDFERYREWVEAGHAGEMRYLTDRRAEVRRNPRRLLEGARSIICVGKLYQTPWPHSTDFHDPERGWISRYAWGEDYHAEMRRGLERLESMLRERTGGAMEAKICVDTAPLLERTYARMAGLGWIGKNTCLIREGMGSWFFLGELLVSLEIEPDGPPPDRCGTCTRCIEACPTQAITAPGVLDAKLCISYLTIELKGHWPEESRAAAGAHVFGCDICQDVCPWNRKAPVTADAAFAPRTFAPDLEKLAALSEAEFRAMFAGTPVTRPRYAGFLRNVAIAMGNSGREQFRTALERLVRAEDPTVAEAARWALGRLEDEHGRLQGRIDEKQDGRR
jgi:epoxyqueuosine reductase